MWLESFCSPAALNRLVKLQDESFDVTALLWAKVSWLEYFL